MKSLENPDVVVLGGAGFFKLYGIEVRKFTVNNKISWIHLLIVPVVPFYCTIIVLSEFVPIETYHCHILQCLAYFLQKNCDFSGRKYCKYWGSTVGCTEKTCSIKRTNI